MTDRPLSAAPDPGRQGWRVLIFTLAPIVAIAALLLTAAVRQNWFSPTDRLYVFADTGVGITTGMPVKIKGFAVGTVTSLDLVPPEEGKPPKVRIALKVNREYMAFIGKDAVLRLTREGLVGQPILEIFEGDSRARRVADADVLAFDRPLSLNEIVDKLNSRAEPLLSSAGELLGRLKDPDGDLMSTVATARQIARNVDATTVAVGALAKKGETVVAAVGQQAEKTLAVAEKAIVRGEQVMPKVDAILDNVIETTHGAAVVMRRAEGAIGDGEQLLGEADEIVRGARQGWPLRLWLPKPPPATVELDSQDHGKAFIVPAPTRSAP